MKKSRDLEFLFELGALRNMPRAWVQYGVVNPASNLEHTLRVIFLALLIARREKKGDEAKIMKMALIHDIPESRTGDHNYLQKVYVEANEDKAIHDIVEDTAFKDFEKIFHEYEKRTSIEAKIVKDADNLDVDMEMKEFEEIGSNLTDKWEPTRRIVREEKFYTETARQLWDEIQTADPAAWHLLTNKWYKQPKAGR